MNGVLIHLNGKLLNLVFVLSIYLNHINNLKFHDLNLINTQHLKAEEKLNLSYHIHLDKSHI